MHFSRRLSWVCLLWIGGFSAACRPTHAGAGAEPGEQLRTAVEPLTPGSRGPMATKARSALEPAPPMPASLAIPSPPRLSALATSALALRPSELTQLAQSGFVISGRQQFPTFAEGWLAIYKADLPLYISADALLFAVHRSYDAILTDLEQWSLIPLLDGLLLAMRGHLASADGQALAERARADADLFLGVALDLLRGAMLPPVAGAAPTEIAAFVDRAVAAGGGVPGPLFGATRNIDFSQFKPRGHYATELEPGLGRYFRAVMWLGRVDARLTGPGRGGSLEVNRRELDLACALRALMHDAELAAWNKLEATMDTFVGVRDAMGPADVDRLYRDLGVHGMADLAGVPDARLLATLRQGHYGEQRISSDIVAGSDEHPEPLHRSFSFTGQRYTVDSQVFSDLVYDRVTPPPGKPRRLMPSPLDLAYVLFRSEEARGLLASELERYGYGPNLATARNEIGAQGATFWDSSLYTRWLGAIRELGTLEEKGLPAVATTDAWRRRMLSSQLASWAELRHDALLYAKQSYTGSIMCSFPDVYVDPYPRFYDRLAHWADTGGAAVRQMSFGQASWAGDRAAAFFRNLASAARSLERVARAQQRGEPASRDDLAFVNAALAEEIPKGGGGCGGPSRIVRGWYIDLFYRGDALEGKPTIADVHTQPTDDQGADVGRVLHVATGWPRVMVVNVDGKRAFVGLVSAYAELVTDHFRRMNDEEWQASLGNHAPDEVPWMRELVAR